MAWRTLLLATLLASVGANYETREADLEVQFSECGERGLDELAKVVRSLLPLKQMVIDTQNQVKEMLSTTEDTKRFLSRIKADDATMVALRQEAALLRREVSTLRAQQEIAVSAARMQGRAARAEVSGRCEQELVSLQTECVAKIMQLGNEAKENLEVLRDENQNLTDTLAISAQRCNASIDVALEELRIRNLELLTKLDIGCPEVAEEIKKKGRHGKLSPGKVPKPESSVTKMPPSIYKHSCKGFTDPSQPVAPSPYESSVRIGNRQYIVGKEKVTWGEAWRLCKARGMWVLTVETEMEQQQLEPHLMHMHHTPTDYWIFARKSPSNGLFSWECAESDFEPWRHQSNDQQGAQDSQIRCAHIQFHRSEPAWSDSQCDTKLNYICRKIVNECA